MAGLNLHEEIRTGGEIEMKPKNDGLIEIVTEDLRALLYWDAWLQ